MHSPAADFQIYTGYNHAHTIFFKLESKFLKKADS